MTFVGQFGTKRIGSLPFVYCIYRPGFGAWALLLYSFSLSHAETLDEDTMTLVNDGWAFLDIAGEINNM